MYLLLCGRLTAGVEAKITSSEVAFDVIFKVCVRWVCGVYRGHLHTKACVWGSEDSI